MNATKKAFADQLRAGLTRHYRGKLPSYNVIARDFTLRAPELPPVSSETVRHWLLGESLPHLSRMQILMGWLGQDLGCIHNPNTSAESSRCNKGQLEKTCPQDRLTLCDMIERLDHQESQALVGILQMLIAKHDFAGGGG